MVRVLLFISRSTFSRNEKEKNEICFKKLGYSNAKAGSIVRRRRRWFHTIEEREMGNASFLQKDFFFFLMLLCAE